MNLSCPKCGSDNTQSCSVIFNAGTSSHSAVTRDDRGNEVTTSGATSTNLASMVAPPAKKDTSTPLGVAIVCAFFAFFSVVDHVFVLAAVLGIVAFVSYGSFEEANKFNTNEYPKMLDEWQNSYYCHRCGNRFIVK